jgi:hypothetical protein
MSRAAPDGGGAPAEVELSAAELAAQKLRYGELVRAEAAEDAAQESVEAGADLARLANSVDGDAESSRLGKRTLGASSSSASAAAAAASGAGAGSASAAASTAVATSSRVRRFTDVYVAAAADFGAATNRR